MGKGTSFPALHPTILHKEPGFRKLQIKPPKHKIQHLYSVSELISNFSYNISFNSNNLGIVTTLEGLSDLPKATN